MEGRLSASVAEEDWVERVREGEGGRERIMNSWTWQKYGRCRELFKVFLGEIGSSCCREGIVVAQIKIKKPAKNKTEKENLT